MFIGWNQTHLIKSLKSDLVSQELPQMEIIIKHLKVHFFLM